MTLFALGFVFGAWLLQQQTLLPEFFIGLQASWILSPSLAIWICLLKSSFKYQHYYKKFSTFVFASLLGFIWAANFAAIRLSDELPIDWQQKSINVIGVVASLPEVTERGERFRFDVEKILTKDDTHTLKIPRHISLNFYKDIKSPRPENAPSQFNFFRPSQFHAGERWQFTVRLKRPHTTYNPHGFDFEAWALAENIRATGSIHSKSGYKKLANFVWRPSYVVEILREKVGNHISQTLANKPYTGVIRALVVGDDSQISAENWNVFLRTGVNHLVSISGLHITMLAGLAFAVTAFFWRRIPSLVMRMPTRKAATIVGLVVAIIYALLAGMSVPTQRTLLMLATFALALLFGKNLAISRALALAVLVVVIVDPWAVNAPGFWLSFGAVALIAYVTVGRLKPLSSFKTAVHTQWAITLGLLPLLIIMFGQASIISPIANAFAIPVISLLVVPLSILGSIIPIDFILQAAHFILELCMRALNYLANLPTWQQAAPPIWALLLAMLGVVWLLLPRGFPQRWLGLVLLLPLFFVSPEKIAEGAMKVTVLDVGQGLAVTIQTKNHVLLYDAGPRYSAQSDAGGRIVVPFLRGAGVKKLDGFIVSHDDIDHSGGAASVLTQLPVTWLMSSFEPIEITTKKSIRCIAGQTWLWDKVKFEVLYPDLASYQNTNLKDNNRSCVLKVTSQFGSILLTGDIEKEAENVLLNADISDVIGDDALQANSYAAAGDAISSRAESQLKSDVLIAPHHGSKTSSTREFVQAVGAQHSIFTVGYLNRFKHPKPLIEKRFEESGAYTYRSDYQGALTIDFSRQKNIRINALRQSQPRYWHDAYPSQTNLP
jgi:competence protein ComEC